MNDINNKKKVNRHRAICFAIALFAVIGTVIYVTVNDTKQSQEYEEVYCEVIDKYCEELDSDKEPTFSYIYFNEDDIPDLVIDLPGYYVSLYVYSEGVAVPVMEREAYGAGGFTGYVYLPHESLVYEALSGMAGAKRELSFIRYHINGPVVCSEIEAECNVSYLQEVAGGNPPEVDFDKPHYEYYSDSIEGESQIIERYQQYDGRMEEFLPLNGELLRDEFEKNMHSDK